MFDLPTEWDCSEGTPYCNASLVVVIDMGRNYMNFIRQNTATICEKT
jgi:hypothetical protein